jgi:rubredoxin
MSLYKCSICNLVLESDEQIEVCPKCGAKKERIVELSEEVQQKIYAADKTNALLASLIALSDQILDVAKQGIDINLDPGCLKAFQHAKNEAYSIRQFAKAEIETHVKKEKF